MPERPGQWTLLDHPSDPVVADTGAIDDRLSYFTNLAEMIRVEGERLQRIANGDALVGKYADELRSASGSVASDLTKVVGRYDAVVQALTEFRPAVDVALSGSASALDDAIDANGAQQQANAMPLATATAGTPLTAQQVQQNSDRTSATDAATDRLQAAKAKLSAVLGQFDQAGSAAAAIVRRGFNDGLKDSGWDRFKYAFKKFLKILVKILTYIGMALAVIALVIPGVGELVFAAGIAIGGVVLAADIALKAMGDGSWLDIGIAIAGLLTFGAAKVFGPAINAGIKSAMGTIRGAFGSGSGIAADVGASVVGRGVDAGVDAASDAVGSGAASVISRGDSVAGDVAGDGVSAADSAAVAGTDTAVMDGDAALTDYLGGGAQAMNRYLRSGVGGDAAMDSAADLVSAKLGTLPIAKDGTYFRGLVGDFTSGLSRGQTYVDDGFMSVSNTDDVANNFIATGGDVSGAVQTTGTGTMFKISSYGRGGDVTGYTGLDEGEVIFDRGTPWTVAGVSKPYGLPVNGQTIVVKTVYLDTPGYED